MDKKKRDNMSTVNLFLKIVLVFNIVLISIGAIFIHLNNKNMANHVSNSVYRDFVINFDSFIVFGGVFLTLINILIFISINMYSRQKYFKVLERIDFDNIEEAINMTKNINNMDEFGYMGRHIKQFLEIYIKFSNMKRLRIDFEVKKSNLLLNILEKGAILLIKERDSYLYKIRAINNKAAYLLNLKDKRSIILGKQMDSILEKTSSARFYSIVDAFASDKAKDIFSKPEKVELRVQANLVEIAESINQNQKQSIEKKPVYSSFFTEVYPLIFKWNYDLEELGEEESEEVQNSIADSILVVFQEKKLVWKGEINV